MKYSLDIAIKLIGFANISLDPVNRFLSRLLDLINHIKPIQPSIEIVNLSMIFFQSIVTKTPIEKRDEGKATFFGGFQKQENLLKQLFYWYSKKETSEATLYALISTIPYLSTKKSPSKYEVSNSTRFVELFQSKSENIEMLKQSINQCLQVENFSISSIKTTLIFLLQLFQKADVPFYFNCYFPS